MTTILYAVAVLGALGVIFGVILTIAGKVFHVEVDERIEKIKDCLGGANCGACGYPGCDGLAQAIVKGEAKPNACAPAGDKGAKAIARIMGVESETSERQVARLICQGREGICVERYEYSGLPSCMNAVSMAGGPKLCNVACVGLGDCIRHCSFGAIQIVDGLCVIDEEKCTGCGACVNNCPRHAIELMPVSQSVIVRCRNAETARVARSQCMRACIGCGRCTKECAYGAIAVENGFARIDPGKCTKCGACAKVCPCQCISIPEEKE